MGMTTTVSLAFEGPSSCQDCQRQGIPVCDHIGFNDAAWIGLPGDTVQVAGLDRDYQHIVRAVDISADRKTVTLTVDTMRPAGLDLARHLSTLPGPKALVRCVDATGTVLVEGAYDAFLQPGAPVWVNGGPYLVETVDHPNRHPDHGATVDDALDWQVATVRSTADPDEVTARGEE